MSTVTKGFQAVDGTWHGSISAAKEHNRRPLIEQALVVICAGNAAMAKFLFDTRKDIEAAFEIGVVARVTKSEKRKLDLAAAHLKTLTDPKLAFLVENADAMVSSFRWPAQKRLTPEEKAEQTLAALAEFSDEKAANWIVANIDSIKNAYNAGIEKRVLDPKAAEGLARYQAAKKAEKEAAEAERRASLTDAERAAEDAEKAVDTAEGAAE